MAFARAVCCGLGQRKYRLPYQLSFAFISTSKKSKDTLVFPDDALPKKSPPPPTTVEDFAETKPRNWMSYGFSEESYERDRFEAKVANFCLITVIMVGVTFIFAYKPDVGEQDWTMREAYLELHRREKHGLPLIDKNYVDPEKVILPSDEELGDTDIII